MTAGAPQAAPHTRFGVLGPLEVTVNGEPCPVGPPKRRTLLAALLTAPGQTVPAERLIGELWPDGPPPTATAALQVHVAGLRRIVGTRLRTNGSGYLLDAAAADVDAQRFEALLGQARVHRAERPEQAAGELREALALWRGTAFEGVPGGRHIQAAAARLTESRLAAFQDLADLELARGRHRDIVEDLGGWVVQHPYAERLVAAWMLALHRCGRSGEALTGYRQLVERLAADLRAEPRPEVAALAAAIRRQDPTIDAAQVQLPSQAGRFIGRRQELDRAAELLGRARLLTVTGAGGCGKTRLAVELGRESAADHPDGVFMVELAGQPAPSEPGPGPLAARVAAVVGARETPGQTVLQALTQWLAERRVLLILDNCEHLIDSCAALAGHLVAGCPRVRILATSREPLGLPGEVTVPLGGLSLPAPGTPLRQALHSDAVRLLTERVARGLRPDEQQVAVELCRRLDGLPLAIELAAARLRAVSVTDVVRRLDRALDLLVGRSIVERHRTMRAAIDWSHDLLDQEERTLFRRLSVLVGGFDLAMAETIGGDPGQHPAAVSDLLTRLVDRSLVSFHPTGNRPYRMIETIREYALERLAASDDHTWIRQRHAEYCARLVEPAPPTDGPAHSAWLSHMESQHDNVRAALEWCLGDGEDPSLALTIASAMWWYWWVAGQMAEGRVWLRRALDGYGPQPSPLRGRALRAAASLARNSGDLAEARRLGEESLRVFRALGDETGVITALNNLSITAQGQSDFEASLSYGYEGLRLAETNGPLRAVAAALNNTAGTLRCMGRCDEAAEMFTRALGLFRELSDRRGEAAALTNLAVVARRRGRCDESRVLALRFLRLYRELGIAEGQLDGVEAVGYLEAVTGRHESALRLLTVARQERDRLGAPIFTPDEVADRDHAERLARAGLSPERAAGVEADAASADLDSTVADLLGPAQVGGPSG